MFFRAGAVAFRFRSDWDIAQAVYRIDGGSPRTMRDDLPALVALRTPYDRGPMGNATQGIVWVPFEQVKDASSIAIQPRPNKRVRVFHLRGLTALHATAVERGCAPDSRFVER